MESAIALIVGIITAGPLGYFYAVHTRTEDARSPEDVPATLDSDTTGLL